MGLVGGGAQAEAVVVHEDEAMPVPDGLSFAEAAAIPEAFLTAYDALVTRGRLAPGERVLIHAVGSGRGDGGGADRQAPRRHGHRHVAERGQAGARGGRTGSTPGSTPARAASPRRSPSR